MVHCFITRLLDVRPIEQLNTLLDRINVLAKTKIAIIDKTLMD